jgi:hypothetical protein
MENTLSVPINRSTHAALGTLAEETEQSMTDVLQQAVDAYRKQRFLAGLNADFAALRKDREAWKRETAERAAWDATLADGLED